MNAFDPLKDRGPVPSPCIDVCTMNARTGLCDGCQRTLDEIACWSTATEEEKRAVWIIIRQRQDGLF